MKHMHLSLILSLFCMSHTQAMHSATPAEIAQLIARLQAAQETTQAPIRVQRESDTLVFVIPLTKEQVAARFYKQGELEDIKVWTEQMTQRFQANRAAATANNNA